MIVSLNSDIDSATNAQFVGGLGVRIAFLAVVILFGLSVDTKASCGDYLQPREGLRQAGLLHMSDRPVAFPIQGHETGCRPSPVPLPPPVPPPSISLRTDVAVEHLPALLTAIGRSKTSYATESATRPVAGFSASILRPPIA